MSNKTIFIFSPRMATYLAQHGCEIITTRPDREHPQCNLVVLRDTPYLRELMAKYSRAD